MQVSWPQLVCLPCSFWFLSVSAIPHLSTRRPRVLPCPSHLWLMPNQLWSAAFLPSCSSSPIRGRAISAVTSILPETTFNSSCLDLVSACLQWQWKYHVNLLNAVFTKFCRNNLYLAFLCKWNAHPLHCSTLNIYVCMNSKADRFLCCFKGSSVSGYTLKRHELKSMTPHDNVETSCISLIYMLLCVFRKYLSYKHLGYNKVP